MTKKTKPIFIGKILITIVAIITVVGPYLADWNQTHIFNEKWPPHAKFHNAQTILLGTMLGLLVLWLLWIKREDTLIRIQLATILASFYWLGQVGATLFPGTALVDPEFRHVGQLPFQLILDAILLGMLSLAYKLEIKRFGRT